MRLLKISAVAVSLSMVTVPTVASANYCQPGTGGCVLPLPGPAPAPPPVSAEPVPVVETAAPAVESGFGISPLLIGAIVLAVLALAAFLLLDDDEEDVISP